VAAAVPRLQKAVGWGVRNAMLHLGHARVDGAGISRSDSEASTLYLRACSLGDHWACGSLGALVVYGRSKVTDVNSGVALLQFACEMGDATSCLELGDVFQTGRGALPKDEGKALWAYGVCCQDLEDEECCEAEDELIYTTGSDAQTPTTAPLPRLKPLSTWSTPSPTVVVTKEKPGPRPGPSPQPISLGGTSLSLHFGAGSQRSWTEANQASAWRIGVLWRVRMLGLGAELDWVSDNRWRPKVARDYWRMTGFLNARVLLPLGRGFTLGVGVGGGLGGYRPGPANFDPIQLSYGAQEFLTFGWGSRGFMASIRLEQQQLFQSDPGLHHNTAILGMLGVTFD